MTQIGWNNQTNINIINNPTDTSIYNTARRGGNGVNQNLNQ